MGSAIRLSGDIWRVKTRKFPTQDHGGRVWTAQKNTNDVWNKMVHNIRKVAKERIRCFWPNCKESWWWDESVQSKVRIKIIVLNNGIGIKMRKLGKSMKKLRMILKKMVSEARNHNFDGLYQSIGIK